MTEFIWDIAVNFFCSFMGTVCFSILFNVPRRYYLYCGLTGAAGWLCYCASVGYFGAAGASFTGTIVVVLLSRILAVWKKCPITIFLVSGIFPLIPGVSVYYTAYYLVTESLGLAVGTGLSAVKIAFSIVLGIVFVVSIPKRWFKVQFWAEKLSGKKEAGKEN